MCKSQPDIIKGHLLTGERHYIFPSCIFTFSSVNVIILNLMLAAELTELKHVIFRKKQSCYAVVKTIIPSLAQVTHLATVLN